MVQRDRTTAECVDDQTQGRQLGRRPPQIGHDDGQARDDLYALAITMLVEVADRHQVHAVKKPREQQSRQDQADGRTERIAWNAGEPVAREGGRHREHGFSTEPGRKDRGHVHVERQTAPSDHEILGRMHTACGDQSDRDGDSHVGHNKNNQRIHDRSSSGQGLVDSKKGSPATRSASQSGQTQNRCHHR